MSLLISGAYYPPQVGGLSQFMSQLAAAIGPQHICCLTGVRPARHGVDGSQGPRVYRCPMAFGGSKYRRAVGAGAVIAQIMVQQRPQVTVLGTIDDGHLGLVLRQWFKLPLVVIAAGNEILDVIEERWPKPLLALQTADRVIAISRFTASLVERAGVDPSRIEVVHPGYDATRFRPLQPDLELRKKVLGSRHRGPVILTIGNLVSRKGHDMTIRALPKVLRAVPDATYLVVGDGPCRQQLQGLANELNLSDSVVWASTCADEDLAKLYALCDVFVMPSREQQRERDVEGFGIVFLEASACAKPVIGGRSGGIPEAVVDGVTGFLVEPSRPEQLADAIINLLANPDLAARLGRQGRARVVEDFTWQQVARRVQGILESLTPATR